MTMPELFLTDAEIDALCEPLKQPAAQVRYLRDVLKLNASTKPNGRALVVRSHAEKVLSGERPAPAWTPVEKPEAAGPQPNVEGFLQVINGGRRNGPAKKLQSA
jgi:hypothetical protein